MNTKKSIKWYTPTWGNFGRIISTASTAMVGYGISGMVDETVLTAVIGTAVGGTIGAFVAFRFLPLAYAKHQHIRASIMVGLLISSYTVNGHKLWRHSVDNLANKLNLTQQADIAKVKEGVKEIVIIDNSLSLKAKRNKIEMEIKEYSDSIDKESILNEVSREYKVAKKNHTHSTWWVQNSAKSGCTDIEGSNTAMRSHRISCVSEYRASLELPKELLNKLTTIKKEIKLNREGIENTKQLNKIEKQKYNEANLRFKQANKIAEQKAPSPYLFYFILTFIGIVIEFLMGASDIEPNEVNEIEKVLNKVKKAKEAQLTKHNSMLAYIVGFVQYESVQDEVDSKTYRKMLQMTSWTQKGMTYRKRYAIVNVFLGACIILLDKGEDELTNKKLMEIQDSSLGLYHVEKLNMDIERLGSTAMRLKIKGELTNPRKFVMKFLSDHRGLEKMSTSDFMLLLQHFVDTASAKRD